MGEPRPEGSPKQGQNFNDYRGMQSKILLTRGIHLEVQSTRVTSRSNNNQGHVKHGRNLNQMDRKLWRALHILEIEDIPFNLNVEAYASHLYDKAISRGTSLMASRSEASFSTKVNI